MRIANPIYDVVFKYLLDDEKVARLMLSALLGREVLELQFRPTEIRQPLQDSGGTDILVLRLDFAATVRLEDGSAKLVLIEIQKAHNAMDLQRFRRYLGSNYSSGDNVWVDEEGREHPLPLVTIYFLGQGLENVDVPVLKINRLYCDVATGDEVKVTDPFVEALTHDSIVIQINRLKGRRRNELEQLLAVFDQGQASWTDPHLLDILVDNFPERYREVLRRLERANGERDLHERMELEDDIVKAFQDHAREKADNRKVIEEKVKLIVEKVKLIVEKDKVIGEKDKVIGEKDKVIGEKDRKLKDKDQKLEEKDRKLKSKDQKLEEKDRKLEEKDRALLEKDRLIAELRRRAGLP